MDLHVVAGQYTPADDKPVNEYWNDLIQYILMIIGRRKSGKNSP